MSRRARPDDAGTALWLVALALAGAWLYVRQRQQLEAAQAAARFVAMNPGKLF